MNSDKLSGDEIYGRLCALGFNYLYVLVMKDNIMSFAVLRNRFYYTSTKMHLKAFVLGGIF